MKKVLVVTMFLFGFILTGCTETSEDGLTMEEMEQRVKVLESLTCQTLR